MISGKVRSFDPSIFITKASPQDNFTTKPIFLQGQENSPIILQGRCNNLVILQKKPIKPIVLPGRSMGTQFSFNDPLIKPKFSPNDFAILPKNFVKPIFQTEHFEESIPNIFPTSIAATPKIACLANPLFISQPTCLPPKPTSKLEFKPRYENSNDVMKQAKLQPPPTSSNSPKEMSMSSPSLQQANLSKETSSLPSLQQASLLKETSTWSSLQQTSPLKESSSSSSLQQVVAPTSEIFILPTKQPLNSKEGALQEPSEKGYLQALSNTTIHQANSIEASSAFQQSLINPDNIDKVEPEKLAPQAAKCAGHTSNTGQPLVFNKTLLSSRTEGMLQNGNEVVTSHDSKRVMQTKEARAILLEATIAQNGSNMTLHLLDDRSSSKKEQRRMSQASPTKCDIQKKQTIPSKCQNGVNFKRQRRYFKPNQKFKRIFQHWHQESKQVFPKLDENSRIRRRSISDRVWDPGKGRKN